MAKLNELMDLTVLTPLDRSVEGVKVKALAQKLGFGSVREMMADVARKMEIEEQEQRAARKKGGE